MATLFAGLYTSHDLAPARSCRIGDGILRLETGLVEGDSNWNAKMKVTAAAVTQSATRLRRDGSVVRSIRTTFSGGANR